MAGLPVNMGAKMHVVLLPVLKPIRILKWKVKVGTMVSVGRVILLYDLSPNGQQNGQLKLKTTQVGTVRKLFAKEGDVVYPGHALLELEECTHPTVMKDMCAECGTDLRKEPNLLKASVPMVHSIPELKVSQEQAQILGRADEERLLADKKLVLLVDLDQTLIHTTNDNIPANLKDVYHFQLYGPASPWYHTRLRPGTQKFLKEVSQYYELHICTFGARNYAHMIAMFLDHDGKYFSHRILSRDECFNATSKTANLKALFPCGDNMVCIIDDREDVWNFVPNMIHVKPYHFFKHTGDINAPPGLSKSENDEKEGFDFNELGRMKKSSDTSSLSGESASSAGDDRCIDEEAKANREASEDMPGCDDPYDGEALEDCTEGLISKNPVESNCEKSDSESSVKNSKVLVEGGVKNNNNNDGDTKKSDASLSTKDPKGNTLVSKKAGNKQVNRKKKCAIQSVDTESASKKDAESASKKDTEIASQKDTESTSKKDTESASKTDSESASNIAVAATLKEEEEELIEVEDEDDYLLYLIEILKNIHGEFYKIYNATKRIPDLKTVIPDVRRKVLTGTSLVFSGLVPTNTPLQKSQPYKVAVSLGAVVTPDLTPTTTHVVAVRPGTAKVNNARRKKGLFLVTSNWLWACAERWERVDERLYLLARGGVGNRHPPPHCGSPEHIPTHQNPAPIRYRTPSGRFMDTINPLMSFSSEEIANMDREVEDIFNESESEGEVPLVKKAITIQESDESSSSSSDSLAGEHPHGWGRKVNSRKREAQGTGTESDPEDEDDTPSAKFRRGEPLPSDIELGEEDSVGSDDPPDEVDDGDWNMMGAQLEREFLSGNDED